MSLANPAIGIGDVTSNERGSGARFNTGKTRVDLIPVWLIAADEYSRHDPSDEPKLEALRVVLDLGAWQKGEQRAIEALRDMDTGWVDDCAAVFEYGAKKYASWNWAKGMPWSVPMACAIRHCLAILRGEENDPESGLPHRGHIACNLVMLAQFEQTYREGDDRPAELRTQIEPDAS